MFRSPCRMFKGKAVPLQPLFGESEAFDDVKQL